MNSRVSAVRPKPMERHAQVEADAQPSPDRPWRLSLTRPDPDGTGVGLDDQRPRSAMWKKVEVSVRVGLSAWA